MRTTLDGRDLPQFKKITIKDAAAIASGRAIGGQLNVDRSYQRAEYVLDYDYLDTPDYLFIKNLYERHFAEGTFFRLQVTGTDYPINAEVFIQPQSIVPRWAGIAIEGYSLTLTEK